MIDLLISILILVVIIGAVVAVLRLIPLPPPFATVVYIILGALVLIFLLEMLRGAAFPPFHWR